MRRPSVVASLATVAALLALIALTSSAAAAGPARAHQDRVLAYWTPARLAHAVSRDFVRDDRGRFSPDKGKPGGDKGKPGGGGGSGTVTGASWTGKGAILTGSGKVAFTMGGTDYICTGSVVNDTRSSVSIVLTAAHCVYDESAGGQASGWATNFIFIPSFDTSPTYTCANTTYGCWVATSLAVHTLWANAGGFNEQATANDWGFAVMPAGGKQNKQLDAVAGSFPIQYSGVSAGATLTSFGYPAAGKYHGSDLVYCQGPIFADTQNASLTWGLSCDMTGGSSGGPWLSGDPKTNAAILRSVNSYSYTNDKSKEYGPKFNSRTQSTFDLANSLASGMNQFATGG